MSATEQMEVRDLLVKRLRLDLLGPSSPDEVLRQDREAREGVGDLKSLATQRDEKGVRNQNG